MTCVMVLVAGVSQPTPFVSTRARLSVPLQVLLDTKIAKRSLCCLRSISAMHQHVCSVPELGIATAWLLGGSHLHCIENAT